MPQSLRKTLHVYSKANEFVTLFNKSYNTYE